MLPKIALLLVLAALAVGAIWLTVRAWRSPKAVAKWVGGPVGVVFSLILLVVTVTGARGLITLFSPSSHVVPELKVDPTPERIARGQEIAGWCAGCHSPNGQIPLSGGKNLSDETGMPFGDLYPINLTPAGPLKTWTDGHIFRAIRHGADEKGNRLPVMASQAVGYLSDEDIHAVIAYLRTQPPVQNETPPPNPSFVAAIMSGAGMLPKRPEPAADIIVGPPRGPTSQYGEYMAKWMGCEECHGPNLVGGKGGFLPLGPNLRSVKGWTSEGFITAMRTGKTPFGKQMDSLQMPWRSLGRMPDADLTALHAYLQTLQ
jgi:mono/diheme cytochrome c family protein